MGSALLMAAGVAALGAVAAALHGLDGRGTVAAARGALGMCALFTLAAAAMLVRGVLQADLSLAFVAQHLTTNVSIRDRPLALWADTPGSALMVAALVAVAGTFVARKPAAIAMISATITALLAAAASGGALSRLPWTPIDGLGLPPSLQHPLAVAAALAALLSSVAATITAVVVVQRDVVDGAAIRWTTTTFALLLCTAVLQGTTAVLSGGSTTGSMITGPAGIWLAAAVTTGWSGLGLRRRDLSERSRSIAAAAICGALLAAGLAGLGATLPGPAIQALALISLVAGLGAALLWNGRVTAPRLDGVSLLVLLALGALATAAMTGHRRRIASGRVASGAVVVLDGLTLAHQGISRYETDRAHVLAVALERQNGAGSRLARAERREYFDGRGAVIGDVVSPPAAFRGLWRTRYVWLEEAETGDTVRLRAAVITFETGFWLALIFAAAAAMLAWAARPPVVPYAPLVLCPDCGAVAAVGARWCSTCGGQLAR